MNRAAVRCVTCSLPASMLFAYSTIQRMTYTTDNANNTINNTNANTNQQNRSDSTNNVGNNRNTFAEASTQASFLNDNYYYNNNDINSDKSKIDNMYGDHTINYGKYYGNDDINNRYGANNGQMSSGNDDDGTSDVYEKLSDKYEELIREHRPLIRKVAIVILFVTVVMIVLYMTGTGAYFVKEVQNKRKNKKEEEEDEDNKYSSNDKREKVIGGKPLVFPLDMNTVVNTTDRDVNVNGRTRLAASDASSR